MDANKVGNFILKLRKEKGLTQKEFADQFGVTYQAVSKWENGKNIPDLLILKEICNKYNLDINELLEGDFKTKKNSKKLITILLILITVFISILIFFYNQNNNDFSFKTVSSNCANFNISGSIAYNNDKSYIYISNIEYCGGEDNRLYESLECVLFESNDDQSTVIESYQINHQSTLESFLKDVKFHVDDYESTCEDFDNENIFLLINGKDKDNNVYSYRVPLNLDKTCSLNNSTNS